MCDLLLSVDPYVVQVTGRVVRLYQYYARNVDPEDDDFLKYIADYLARNEIADPKAISYLQLYDRIKAGVREYLHERVQQSESEREG